MKDLHGESKDHQLTVALRIRPLNDAEIEEGATVVAHKVDDQMVVLMDPCEDPDDVLRANRSREKTYMFDVAFDSTSTQEEVYLATTKNLIEGVIAGYNATVFAYGPTGAGKTYTMLGLDSEPGIYIRTLNDLFRAIEAGNEDMHCSVYMSYLEIYNEMIRDLLNPSSGYLDLREDAKGEIRIAGITEFSTSNAKEIMALLTKGNKQRTQEPTAANKTSSRSHAILQVTVKQKSRVKDISEEVKVGKLFMVDLAGTERASQTQNRGKRMKEGAHINRSLLALANCINALSEKGGRGAQFVNYRDSKLTRLLKDALGGNSRTVMITHISPASSNFEESRNTLIYADKAKNITNKVKRNYLNVSYHLAQYTSIIADLRKEIERLRAKIDQQGQEQRKGEKPDIRDIQAEVQQYSRREMAVLREQLQSAFREQMEIRRSLMELENCNMELHIDTSRHLLTISDWERERARCAKRWRDAGNGEKRDRGKDEEQDSEGEEPQDVTAAREEIGPLLAEHRKTMALKGELEERLMTMKQKSSKIEELLPKHISNEEQREILTLLCKVHELELENTEIQSALLCKENALRSKDFIIQRHEHQRALCDDIIHQQKTIIEDHGLSMPEELQELYTLYMSEIRDGGIDQILTLQTLTSTTMRLKLDDIISDLDPNDLCPQTGIGRDNKKSSTSSKPSPGSSSGPEQDSDCRVFKSSSKTQTLKRFPQSPSPPSVSEAVSPDTRKEIVTDTKGISEIVARRRSRLQAKEPSPPVGVTVPAEGASNITGELSESDQNTQLPQLAEGGTGGGKESMSDHTPTKLQCDNSNTSVTETDASNTTANVTKANTFSTATFTKATAAAAAALTAAALSNAATPVSTATPSDKATPVPAANFTSVTGVALGKGAKLSVSVDGLVESLTDGTNEAKRPLPRPTGSSQSTTKRDFSRFQRPIKAESPERLSRKKRSRSFEVNGKRQKPKISPSRNRCLESISDHRLVHPSPNTTQPVLSNSPSPLKLNVTKLKQPTGHHAGGGQLQKLEIRGTPPSTIHHRHAEGRKAQTLHKQPRSVCKKGPTEVSSTSHLLQQPGNYKKLANGKSRQKGATDTSRKKEIHLKKVHLFGNFWKDLVMPPPVSAFSQCFGTSSQDVTQGARGCSTLHAGRAIFFAPDLYVVWNWQEVGHSMQEEGQLALGVPEGGGSNGEDSITPGPVLGPAWYRQEFCIRGTEALGRSVEMEQVGEIGGGLVMEGFEREKENFE
ncbi:kinesin-like protein KIF19 [Chanos chanos]|uniref:Kinesin-like protein KIF19 n=1 Tax=Chanos chanos TaxID=29144 RepID=A0A6J2VSK5_CHACN|nr:kinesin-like protein KIF19 [Chanos chanos]